MHMFDEISAKQNLIPISHCIAGKLICEQFVENKAWS